MKNILLKISYDGTSYCGWQRQNNAISVQQKIEDAIFKLTGNAISIFGASRTDAGVHAYAQMATFLDSSNIPADKFSFALNANLPADIRIIESKEVQPTFNPRYDAIKKTYQYHIHNSLHASAILRNHSYHVYGNVNFGAMQEACSLFIGTHDFSSFEASGGITKSKIRTIFDSKLLQNGEKIIFEITGNGFLYNMVRIMAGTLIDIGKNKISKENILLSYESKNRNLLGHTAPAQGLFLYNINY